MKRSIRSYVVRAARMSPRQQLGWKELYPRYALPEDQGVWNYEVIFGRSAPVILEIGFGMGHSLCVMAQENPEKNYIGIEVHPPGVGALANSIHEHTLQNVRLIAQDAVNVLEEYIPNDSLAGVQIYFPDPWPKKKHHKRRLIQAPLVHLLAKKISLGGFIHCATDWQDYAEQMLSVLSEEPMLKNSSKTDGYVERPASRPLTKFEQRGKRLGHGVWDLIFVRV